ncbi:MAG TPA: sigma factor-like helix-turn-helix DNA-binding protein [Kofleriaceae bacterium]|nr:sigma factor-like helix-turn-helix DNA-binding protein [Kofleriaceae bacterium]
MTREADLYAEGRAAWPGIEVSPDRFAGAVSGRDPVDAAEVYLACACAAGDAAAIRAFEARYFACIAPVARRHGLGADDASEIAQILRQRLFVGDGAPPRVLDYAGKGQLGGLVQVAATRLALNVRRGRKRLDDDEPADDSDAAPAAGADAAYAKAEYREHIRRALEEAAAELPARDRTLLRMHFVDRATIDDIAALYRVHRATAARWVTAAREALVAASRARFVELAKLTEDDSGGLASFVESQLTLSLDRILV